MSVEEASPSTRNTAVVYGLSSEGYHIASNLAVKGYRVSVVDEVLGTTMELLPEIAADYVDLKALLSEEPLVRIRSQKEALSTAKVVFFAPKVRRHEEDILVEIRTRIADLSKSLSEGTLVVFCLPLGLGGANDILERLERGSGLLRGKGLSFAYSPIDSGKPHIFGSNDDLSNFNSSLEAAGFSLEIFKLQKAELIHAQRVISRQTTLASQLESSRRLTLMDFESPREYRQTYVEDINSSIFDLKVVMDSLESGDPFLYLGSGSMRSVESYPRFLVDRIREMVRHKDLKASRLRITLLTDTDYFEIRGDKLNMATDLVNRLKDFFSDIEYLNVMNEGFTLPTSVDRNNLFVFLSGSAEQKITQVYEDQLSMTKPFMIRANLPVEFVN